MATQTLNLHEKFAGKDKAIFTMESVVGGILSNDYDWEGNRTIKVTTIGTTPENDYRRSGDNRYGEPTEVGDTIQELEVTQDKGFSSVVDKGNYVEQDSMKTSAVVTAKQLKEVSIPNSDRYILQRMVSLAGQIVGSADPVTADNSIDRVTDGTVALDDGEVPDSNRTMLCSAKVYKQIRLSDLWTGNDKMGEKALRKGEVGEFDNMRVIKVPKGRWPKGVNFIIVHKDAAIAPFKINDLKAHEDPPGLSGLRVEGRRLFDCFVFDATSVGVYADVDTTVKGVVEAPVVTLTGHQATVDAAAGVEFIYTLTGQDPRYTPAKDVKTYTAPVTTELGQVFKVYGRADDKWPSGVTTAEDKGQ